MASNRPNTVLTTGSVASEVSMLFRTKRVSEIRAIESRIRTEAEEKSDALRELLGTRYKDLLEAADEMVAIRDSCSVSVCDALRDMAKSTAELREHFMKKSGRDATSSALSTNDLERRKNVHVIGSKLKHIVDSPEVLYAYLESGNVYDAAVRYALASRNYAELQQTSGLEGVANRFAEQRWKQVQVFKDQILAMAEKKLVTYGLATDTASRVVAALVILSGKDRDILATLDGMFASRTAWIDDQNRSSTGTVPSRVQNIASIVKGTISCMAGMFWRDDEACVERLLREVDEEAAEDLKRMRESGALRTCCENWINDAKVWLEENGKQILVGADSSRTLADTLRAIEEVFAEEGWPADCESVLGQSPKHVFDIFTPFIRERAAFVASASIQRAVDKVVSDVDTAWTDLKVGPDAGKLVWANASSQIFDWNTDSDRFGSKPSSAEESDVRRAVAANSQVENVVGVFESALQEALSDVTALTQRIPSVATAFDSSIQSSLPRILAAMKTKLESVSESFSDDSTSQEESCEMLLEKSLFIARSATALGSAPCVKSAYQFCDTVLKANVNNMGKSKEDSAQNRNGFVQFCAAADKLSMAGYQTWANRLCLHLKDFLRKELVAEEVLGVPMGWAGLGADNTVDEDSRVEEASNLRYPTTASTAAVKFILRACRFVNRAGGFALPHQAIDFLRGEMSVAAVEAYKAAIRKHSEHMPDTNARLGNSEAGKTKASDVAMMQMLFDVLVLQQLLGEPGYVDPPRDTKSSLKGTEQQLSASIDPIDLASCKKPLQGAVSGYLSRTCILFGTITRSSSGPSPNTRPVSSTSQLASSNLVSLARTVPRFTYLPAPMPSTYSTVGSGTAGLSAKAALGALRSEATSSSTSAYRKREADTSVAGYASKVSESVGRFGRGFFESLTRKVG